MDDAIPDLYHYRFQPGEREQKLAIWAQICRYFEGRYIGPTDTVLDLGAGDCMFVNQIRCGRRFAVDLSPHLEEHVDPESGRTFYFDPATQESSWERPATRKLRGLLNAGLLAPGN